MDEPDVDEPRAKPPCDPSVPAALGSQPQSSKQARRMVRTRRRLAKQKVREALKARLKREYEAGASIRTLATAHKVAFGTVRSLLLDADVTLRSRGGPNHRRRDSESGGTP